MKLYFKMFFKNKSQVKYYLLFFFFFASGMESQFGTMSHTFHLRLQKPINKCLPVIITVPLWPKLILFWTFISVFLSSLKKKITRFYSGFDYKENFWGTNKVYCLSYREVFIIGYYKISIYVCFSLYGKLHKTCVLVL